VPNVLTINGGSSSIRFAVFAADRPPRRLLRGELERIGSDDAHLSVEQDGRAPMRISAAGKEPGAAIGVVLDWLE
jgi:acetate kinase